MRRTALAALCLAATATVSLTGCLPGEDKADSEPKGPFAGLTGGEIADRAVKATSNTSSLRMKADIEEDGVRMSLDMALDKKGQCAGTISEGQGKTDLIKTGDTLYLRYDEKFLRAQGKSDPKAETDAVVEMLAGKWTKMAATGSDAKEMASFCDLDTTLSEFEDGSSNATRGKTTTVDGTPAIVLREKDGKDTYTLYVATEGKPYLLKVVSKTAEDPGTVTYSDFDKPVPAEAPKGKVIDLDALGG
ncbi:hypothetical protein [Streptomyces albicerus]|uniref:hypothetical protein n=1 Tax=Streptomyces albicerus TaxID=2569859 RepID=UPI00124B6CBF|nr:hypothetical protein [Streptomyces albicerus]